jgi:DNA-binding CsgD family transcriptional regulator/F0F1-type ATP synthase assembly protein I
MRNDTPNRLFDFRLAGWGFLLAWKIALPFSGAALPFETSGPDVPWLLTLLVEPLLFALLVFSQPLFGTKTRCRLLTSTSTIVVCSATAGCALFALVSVGEPLGTPLFHALRITATAGSIVLAMLWFKTLSSRDIQTIERSVLSSFALALILCALVLVIDARVSTLVVAFFPLASGICLNSVGSQHIKATGDDPPPSLSVEEGIEDLANEGDEDDNDSGKDRGIRAIFLTFARTGLGLLCISAVIGAFWFFVKDEVIRVPSSWFAYSLLASGVATFFLLLYYIRVSNRLNLNALYRCIVPLLLAGLAALAFRNTVFTLLSCSLVFATKLLLELVATLLLAKSANMNPARFNAIFGIGYVFIGAGIVLGTALAWLLDPFVEADPVALIAVLILMAALSLIAVMSSVIQDGRVAFMDMEPTKSRAELHAAQQISKHERKCERATGLYGLSKRESEVLRYWAMGYGSAHIEKELFIQHSTVDSHIRHIYAKMDIHSKGELLQLLDDLEG